jgi:hypothetical protein
MAALPPPPPPFLAPAPPPEQRWRRRSIGWILLHSLIGLAIGFTIDVVTSLYGSRGSAISETEPSDNIWAVIATILAIGGGWAAWMGYVYLKRTPRARLVYFLVVALCALVLATIAWALSFHALASPM